MPTSIGLFGWVVILMMPASAVIVAIYLYWMVKSGREDTITVESEKNEVQ